MNKIFLLLALSSSILFPASEKAKVSEKHALTEETDSTGYAASSDGAEKQRIELVPSKHKEAVSAFAQALPVTDLRKIVLDYLSDEGKWEKIQTIPSKSYLYGVGLSQDHKYLALGTYPDGKIFVFKNGQYEHLQDFPNERFPIKSFAFAKNNKYLATASNRSAKLRELKDGQYSLVDDFQGLYSENRLTFSVDGRYLVIGSGNDIKILEFDPKENSYKEKQIIYIGENTIKSVAISPDNQYIAAGLNAHGQNTNNRVQILEFKGGSYTLQKQLIHPGSSHIMAVAFTKDYLASGGEDGKIRIYVSGNGEFKLKQTIDRQSGIQSLSFSEDGQYLAVGTGGNRAEIFQLIDGQYNPKQALDMGEYVAFSADGSYLVTAIDFEINVWINTKKALE